MFTPLTRASIVALAVLLPSMAMAQDPPDTDSGGNGFRWRNRPSLQFGELRLDLRFKVAYDWREFDPDLDDQSGSEWRFRRGGVNGELGDHLEFQIERDLNPDGRWRDVYANWRTFRQFQVTAGRFKVPFGREELTSISSLDFAFRTLASTTIPPARDRGVMAHGRFFQRGLTYEVGVFKDDGDNGRLQEPQFVLSGDIPGFGPSVAGRLTAVPFRRLGDAFDTLSLGVAMGWVDLPEGLNSLRGETVFGTDTFFEPVYVKGRRTRVGLELSYLPGPVGLVGEWMQAREQRHGQALDSSDLSDLIGTGWYAAATWLVTGEDKEDFDNPRRPLFDGGFGAVELGARYEKLQFESADQTGPAFSNPRAEHILSNSDAVWTFGVNWFPNRWVRVTTNAIHEEFADPERTPIAGRTNYWSALARVQFVF